jgi:hypothetical protein
MVTTVRRMTSLDLLSPSTGTVGGRRAQNEMVGLDALGEIM